MRTEPRPPTAPADDETASTPPRQRDTGTNTPNGRGLVALLALGHALNDFYATILSPVLVELGRAYALTTSQVQVLPALTGVFGSVAQPFVGILGDRVGRRWLIVGGTACAALFMSAVGFANSLPSLVLLIILGSAGVSAFHPNAASLATASASRRGLSFATFLTGGAVGLTVCPLVVTQVVARTGGLRHLLWLCLPGLALAAAYALRLRGVEANSDDDARPNWRELVGRGSGALWLLFVVVALRSIPFTTFMSFMGHLCEERGWDITLRGVALSVFMGCSAAGGMLGGWLSDFTNRRAMLIWSSIVASALLAGFALTSDYRVALLLLVPGGAIVSLAGPMLVVTAQDLCPSNRSAASGVMMGLAWGVAGLPLPLIGMVADVEAVGTSGALAGVASLTALAGVLAVLLPSIERSADE